MLGRRSFPFGARPFCSEARAVSFTACSSHRLQWKLIPLLRETTSQYFEYWRGSFSKWHIIWETLSVGWLGSTGSTLLSQHPRELGVSVHGTPRRGFWGGGTWRFFKKNIKKPWIIGGWAYGWYGLIWDMYLGMIDFDPSNESESFTIAY